MVCVCVCTPARALCAQRMKTHSQMCNSGDSTLDVMANSVEVVGKEDADEHFVILLSDAEFSRYGIDPTEFADAMTSDPKVNAFIIFIGNTHESADRYVRLVLCSHQELSLHVLQ